MKFFGKKVPVVDDARQGIVKDTDARPAQPLAVVELAPPAPDCAIWNDIVRALDIDPRSAK